MNLVGYINRSQEFPAPLISVVQDGNGLAGIYPSGDKVRFRDVQSVSQLRGRPTFVVAEPKTVNPAALMAFGLSQSVILVGSRGDVLKQLQNEVDKSDPMLSEDGRATVREFLEAANWLSGMVGADRLEKAVNDARGVLTAQVTDRVIERKPTAGHTLVIQRRGRRKTQTLYRKGIPHGLALKDVIISERVVGWLRSALI